jgi:DNA-binding transcriptional MocR family regulator
MPSVQNPTAARLPAERRREIAEIARRHDLMLVQDDVQIGLVEDDEPNLASLAPERVLTIASLSKTFVPGLRVAFLAGARLDAERAREVIWSSIWMASAIGAEIARGWIEDGTAVAMLARRRDEMRARHALTARVLDGTGFVTKPGSYHIWLPLPVEWSTADFTAELSRRGVKVSGADAFLSQRGDAPRAVRVSISGPATRAGLERGLDAIRSLLTEGPPTSRPYL